MNSELVQMMKRGTGKVMQQTGVVAPGMNRYARRAFA